LRTIAISGDVEIVYPVHPNPEVQGPIRKFLQGVPHVHLIPPMDYLPFVYLLSKSHIVITDSGGVQEEAPAFGKPVLVMRDRTERPEGIEAGTAILVGTDVSRIVGEARLLLDDENAYNLMARAHNPFGDGRAAVRIADILEGKDYVPFI
jgi:UDP-N-acetylglucosamine 2-epimerase